jgi:hypothetical protein
LAGTIAATVLSLLTPDAALVVDVIVAPAAVVVFELFLLLPQPLASGTTNAASRSPPRSAFVRCRMLLLHPLEPGHQPSRRVVA